MTNDGADQVHVPKRYSRVDPWIISRDTDAEIAFLTKVFGATETPGARMLDPEGRIGHAEVEIGDAVIMLFDAHGGWPALPSHLRIYVNDVRRVFDAALQAGAHAVTEPTDLPFGERVARLRDPQGHLWWVHERFEDVDPADIGARFADPGAQQAMAYVRRSLATELSPQPDPQ